MRAPRTIKVKLEVEAYVNVFIENNTGDVDVNSVYLMSDNGFIKQYISNCLDLDVVEEEVIKELSSIEL